MIYNEIPNLDTPFYLIDEEKLSKNFKLLKEQFSDEFCNLIIGYSFKTNSLPWIVNWMKNSGAYAEVVSKAEYDLALALGYKPENIIFNGPYKNLQSLEYALENDSIVNLDSFHEVEWIKNNKPSKKPYWKVGLRINFDLEKECPGETIMKSECGRFGFNIENKSIFKAVDELSKLSYVKIVGLHGHHSTITKSLNVFKTISEKLAEVSKHIYKDMEYIDIGGCFFGDFPGKPEFYQYAQTIKRALKLHIDFSRVKLIVEPGTSLIASPVSYICSVLDKKKVGSQNIITTDGSCLNIDPQMHGINFKVRSNSISNEILDSQIICGYTCIEKDRMAKLTNDYSLNIGDKLVFENTGAYTMSLTPLFIQYFPSVVVKSGENYFYARKAWGVEEYLSKNYTGYSMPTGGE